MRAGRACFGLEHDGGIVKDDREAGIDANAGAGTRHGFGAPRIWG